LFQLKYFLSLAYVNGLIHKKAIASKYKSFKTINLYTTCHDNLLKTKKNQNHAFSVFFVWGFSYLFTPASDNTKIGMKE
jgi:hypothetical protein